MDGGNTFVTTAVSVLVPEDAHLSREEQLMDPDATLARIRELVIDVQAHSTTAPQPGPTLAPNSSTGEDGQLQAVYIPQTIGGHGHKHGVNHARERRAGSRPGQLHERHLCRTYLC